jgi:hypothetical protein
LQFAHGGNSLGFDRTFGDNGAYRLLEDGMLG